MMSQFFNSKQQLRFPYLCLLLFIMVLLFLGLYTFVIQTELLSKSVNLPSLEDLFILFGIFVFMVASTAIILISFVQQFGKLRYIVALAAMHLSIPMGFFFFMHTDRSLERTWAWMWDANEPVFWVVMLPIVLSFVLAILLETLKQQNRYVNTTSDTILDDNQNL